MFEKGRLYRRRTEIHGRFGGQVQGGISTPSKYPMIFIFTGEEGKPHGYRDRWLNDDTFEYWGEGQVGDMSFVRGNRALRDHVSDGRDVFLFASTKLSGMYRFVDQLVCTGHRIATGLDSVGASRQEIVFQFVRMGAIGVLGDENDDVTASEKVLAGNTLEELRDRALDDSAASLPVEKRVSAYRQRSAAVRAYARRRAEGTCEGCSAPAPFTTHSGAPYLEVHHIRRLSDDGPDHPSWVAAICPTCHRRAHYAEDSESFNAKLSKAVAAIERKLAESDSSLG